MTTICTAIRARRLLAFTYGGEPRIVAPYCHGASRNGEALRGVQVGGRSRSRGFGYGKLWLVSRMSDLRVTDEPFAPDDPDYNPDDQAMQTIHCRI